MEWLKLRRNGEVVACCLVGGRQCEGGLGGGLGFGLLLLGK